MCIKHVCIYIYIYIYVYIYPPLVAPFLAVLLRAPLCRGPLKNKMSIHV